MVSLLFDGEIIISHLQKIRWFGEENQNDILTGFVRS
jgi:hypothetical protein